MFFSKPKPKPNDVSATLRETLFGDVPLDAWPRAGSASNSTPWDLFVQARERLQAGDRDAAIACWRRIVALPDLETRHYAQAWHALRAHGVRPEPREEKTLLGVVVEVAVGGGLDVLAAYPDHTARYANFSGATIIWEHPDASLDPAIDALLASAVAATARIGVWKDARPTALPAEACRVSFLTPSGLHFGQGPMSLLSADAIGGPVIGAATKLMQGLIAKAPKR